MRFPRQEYWSELPFPSPGDLPDPGIEPKSPALQADSLPMSYQETHLKSIEQPQTLSMRAIEGSIFLAFLWTRQCTCLILKTTL